MTGLGFCLLGMAIRALVAGVTLHYKVRLCQQNGMASMSRLKEHGGLTGKHMWQMNCWGSLRLCLAQSMLLECRTLCMQLECCRQLECS